MFETVAFVAWLDARSVHVDRSLVSQWATGTTHLPADVLPLLAQFTDRPDLVFGEYLHQLRCDVFHLPDTQGNDIDVRDLLLEAGAALGRLDHAMVVAKSADSPGGAEITREENAELLRHLDVLIHQLAELRGRFTPTKR